MKTIKFFLPLTVAIFISTYAMAQNAFNDAAFLVEYRNDITKYRDSMSHYFPRFIDSLSRTDKENLAELNRLGRFLANPYSDSVPLPNIEKAHQTLKAMPFLLKKLQKFVGHRIRDDDKPAIYGVASTGQLRKVTGASLTEIPSSSLLSASQIIDGTALFIKKRIREELKLAFLNQFKDKLDKSPLLQSLLPATYRTFVSIAEMDNQLPSLNNVAMNAFQADMEQLPEHIESTLLYDTAFEDIRHSTNFKYFALPFNTIKHLQIGSHPAFALQDVQDKYFHDKTELDRIIQMMVALNDNLRGIETEGDADEKYIFIDNRKWNSLRQKGGDTLFMALMYRNFKDSIFSGMSALPISRIRQNMQLLGSNVGDYLANLNAFQGLYQALKDENNRTFRDSLALQLTWNVMQLIDKSHLIYFSMLDKKTQETYRTSYWLTYKPIAEATLKATAAMQKRNYAGVALNAFQILRGISEIPSMKNRDLFQNEFLKQFFFYANFMTDILTAYNSEEVGDILDRYAAPVGSYALKRHARFSVSLNTYPGIFMAVENPIGGKNYAGLKKWSFVSGITAPLGFSLNWGGLGGRHNQNVSAFISAIDIGAVLSYRWANDAAEGLPNDVEWAQVLSPGLHVAWGLPKVPLTLLLGYQLSPKLRKINSTNNALSNRSFQRISLGVTVDIPVFNFYKAGRRVFIVKK